jgi:8-oxo-dGTP pyrophosphatase MutT (NUDIX family)
LFPADLPAGPCHRIGGDADILVAALREAREETGLEGLRLAEEGPNATPLDVDVHQIPARCARGGELIEDAHEHHDIRMLVFATDDATPQVSDESHAVAWFTPEQLLAVTTEESVLRMMRKAAEARTTAYR